MIFLIKTIHLGQRHIPVWSKLVESFPIPEMASEVRGFCFFTHSDNEANYPVSHILLINCTWDNTNIRICHFQRTFQLEETKFQNKTRLKIRKMHDNSWFHLTGSALVLQCPDTEHVVPWIVSVWFSRFCLFPHEPQIRKSPSWFQEGSRGS